MNVLILHAAAGADHRRAAEALAKAAEAAGAKAIVCDILEFTPPFFRKTYAEGHLNVIRTVPELWASTYERSNRSQQHKWQTDIRTVFSRLNTLAFFSFYHECQPDAVLCTHFLPLELLANSRKRRQRGVPLFGVLTDFAVHALWMCPHVDCYYVATEEARCQLIRRGQPEDGTAVTGIPVDASFAVQTPAADARARLGLDPALPTVLFMGGGFDVGSPVEFLKAFRAHAVPCQFLLVAGRHERMKAEAEAVATSLTQPVRVYGFVRNVPELMDAADLVVAKPGGLTSAEVLAKGKPLLIVDPIPGQEQRNGECLLEAGAAARLFEIAGAPWKIETLLGDKARLAAMTEAARRAGHPQAAQATMNDVHRRWAASRT